MVHALAVVVAVVLSALVGVAGTMAQTKSDPAQPKMEQKSGKMGHIRLRARSKQFAATW
jgi:hypothetical protein